MQPPMASRDPQLDLLTLRKLVLADTVALQKWKQVVDRIVVSPLDKVSLKKMFREEPAEAILQSLLVWHSSGGQLLELVNAFELCQLNRLADDVRKLWCDGLSAVSVAWFQVDEVEPNFTGRQPQLDTIHKKLHSLRRPDSAQASIVCISGLGGVGKSSLARKYAYDRYHCYDSNVFWIHGETLASIRNSFEDLADFLKIPTTGSEPDKALSNKVYSFVNTRKCLFIFDNVEDNVGKLREFLPQAVPGLCTPYILMTSRRTDILDNLKTRKNYFPLEVLTIAEAVEFIQSARSCSVADATELALKLERLPIALQQAMALILSTSLPEDDEDEAIRSYLKDFDASGPRPRFRESETYESTVLTTWNVTLKKILTISGGAAAEQLLHVLAYLNPDGITVELLTQMTPSATLVPSLNLLCGYSLITICKRVVGIHRLLQHVVTTTLQSNSAHESFILGSIIKFIHAQLVGPRACESSLARLCTTHGMHIHKYLQSHTAIIEQNSYYTSKLCYYAIQYGYFVQAHIIASDCSQALQAVLGPDDPRTMEMEAKVGHCHYRARAYDNAEVIFDSLLDRWTHAGLLLTDKFFLNLRSWKARIYKCRKNFGEALAVLNEIISTSIAIYGPNDYDVLQFTHYKAVVLMRSGDLALALEVFELVYKTMCESLGEGHLSTVRALRYVGTVSRKMGNWKRGLAIHKEVRNALCSLLGAESREVVTADNIIMELEQKLRHMIWRSRLLWLTAASVIVSILSCSLYFLGMSTL